jgi:hypothetical protein
MSYFADKIAKLHQLGSDLLVAVGSRPETLYGAPGALAGFDPLAPETSKHALEARSRLRSSYPGRLFAGL